MPVEGSRNITLEQMNLISDIRYRWAQLAIWNGIYLLNRISGSDSQYPTIGQMHKLPTGFYGFFCAFYGQQQAEEFLNLLNKYLILYRQIIEAMNSGDQEATNAAASELYTNADEIAEFLARINPYWSMEQWQQLLYENINMTIRHVGAELSGNYQQAIDIFDRLQYHSTIIADYMSKGIIQNFMVETNINQLDTNINQIVGSGS